MRFIWDLYEIWWFYDLIIMESRVIFDKIALGVISRLEGIDDVLNVGILKNAIDII